MKSIFVGNLGFGVTEATIRSLFETHGAVERVRMITDRQTGQSRGFCFVDMRSDAEADKAIGALNGKQVAGRVIKVNGARPKTDMPRGSFQRTDVWRSSSW